MKQTTISNRLISLLLCMAMILSLLPAAAVRSWAAEPAPGTTPGLEAAVVADAGTAHTWETMMGTDHDGNRYAGRVWADKSVYTNGQSALLDTSGTAYPVQLQAGESFQLIFSVLGSSMTTTTTNTYVGPMDVVLVLDSSTSMANTAGGVTRLQRTLEAANTLMENLLTVSNIRIALVSYNADSETILPLDFYPNGVVLSANNYTGTGSGGGVITARDRNGRELGKDSGYQTGTNLQAGVDRGLQILADAKDVSGRVPVAIVLTDGEANRAVTSNWYNVGAGSISSSGTTGIALSTMLNAAYGRACVEKNYGKAATVYGIGIDLTSDLAEALMNPADADNGFNSSNDSSSVRTAYNLFQSWRAGETVTSNSGRYRFDHALPQASGVTSAEVAANIHWVDTYHDVESSELQITFTQIYEELTSGRFNPISSTQTVVGATGVENTPLVYVDTIGQYMEIKRIQSVNLFGSDYGVSRNSDGTYTVAEATGVNPTTGESYNTREDIRISVTENADGTQTLRIEIDQEILPILLEKVLSETKDKVTVSTIEEERQQPLRVYYTVGMAQAVLTDGQVMPTRSKRAMPTWMPKTARSISTATPSVRCSRSMLTAMCIQNGRMRTWASSPLMPTDITIIRSIRESIPV